MLVSSIPCEGLLEKKAQANLAFTQKILHIVLYRSLKNSGSHHLPALSPHLKSASYFLTNMFSLYFPVDSSYGSFGTRKVDFLLSHDQWGGGRLLMTWNTSLLQYNMKLNPSLIFTKDGSNSLFVVNSSSNFSTIFSWWFPWVWNLRKIVANLHSGQC